MSAAYVSDDLINFMLAGALDMARRQLYPTRDFQWVSGEGYLASMTGDTVQSIGQMLRDENIRSLESRYQDIWRGLEPMPREFPTRWLTPVGRLRPMEVIKACDYYEYQSSEHAGWWTSDAHSFVDCLRAATWRTTPEYQRANWGEPEHVRSYYRADPKPEGETARGVRTDQPRGVPVGDIPINPERRLP